MVQMQVEAVKNKTADIEKIPISAEDIFDNAVRVSEELVDSVNSDVAEFVSAVGTDLTVDYQAAVAAEFFRIGAGQITAGMIPACCQLNNKSLFRFGAGFYVLTVIQIKFKRI